MNDTVECNNCGMDNAYFDGLTFICPDCDYEWNDSDQLSNNDYEQNELDGVYEEMIKIKEPFFKLKHGKLYDCKIEFNGKDENASIIPLAFEEGQNRQFVMIDARNLYKKNPKHVQEIIEMSFDYIMYDGILTDYPSEYNALTILCATLTNGFLIDYDGAVLSNFVEIDNFNN